MKNIDDIWLKYKNTKDDSCRDEIVKNYLPLVKYHADRVAQHLPPQVRVNDREDLYIEGIIGLMDAIEKFDMSHKVKFETYASKRVRGAIIDMLRREDILPKNVREQAKTIENAYIKLESEYGRKATDEEIAKEIGVTSEAFYDILNKIKGISIVSMDSDLFNVDGERFGFESALVDNEDYAGEYEKKEAVSKLAELIESLDKDERIVLETYYWDGLTLKEIGAVLKVSESRVCQIHTKILLKLKSGFRKLEKER